ncbi:TetR/AcrR family transcriptional regulator C-terminal domain-containing protein [Actinomadura alba]|uniref:Uncharacterized protein n=1 Tax=Actinomadura alba TaxID=406431 RepID=A0ABR7LY19_9ACTN|nr:TetR/AcrR family transcriptional regulator C-terminal domain-containing protein [Actinomadura alba]MBC6469741.1 hypothetical protein [Actinomadura alba]
MTPAQLNDGLPDSPAALGPDLFMIVLQDRLPSLVRRLDGLSVRAGGPESVDEILTDAAQAIIAFYAEIQVAGVGAIGSIHELVRLRQALHAHGIRSRQAIEPLARYLRAEQKADRIAADADPEPAAELLLGGCFHQAFEEMFPGRDQVPSQRERAARTVRGLRL